MGSKSLSKNFIYQILYQILILGIPFVLYPYLTRVLQEEAIGTYTFVNSIATYFVILSNLGINTYGRRLISTRLGSMLLLRKTFWSLFFLHTVISTISIVCYLTIVFFGITQDKNIYYIQSIYIASALFDITWLFYGLENFASVVVRNAFIKIIQCILVFCFVHNSADLVIYTAIISIGSFLGQIFMLPVAIKIIPPILISWNDVRVHIKPLFIFSISVIASSLYVTFDKTLIGIMINKESVAFYDYASKIIGIPQAFISVIVTTMFSRVCRCVVEGKNKEYYRYMEYSFIGVAFIGIGIMFALLTLSNDFVEMYLGVNFSKTSAITLALSPVVYIIGIGSIVRSQCMVANNMDTKFNLCIVYNAILNFVLSISIIPVLGVYGAVIGSLSAEIFGLLYQLHMCRQIVSVNMIIKNTFPFLGSGIFLVVVIEALKFVLAKSLMSLIVEILIGGLIYVMISVLYFYNYRKDIFNKNIIKFTMGR